MNDNIGTYDRKKVIVLKSTLFDSIARGITVSLTFAVMIGLGVYLESSAMQWIGGVIFLGWFISMVNNLSAKNTMTTQEAREYLDKLENGE